MTRIIDTYWSFRSPYSYIAMTGLKKLKKDLGVLINIRPVYPLAVRDDSFFRDMRPQQPAYMMGDLMREAQRQEIPLRWPVPDPIVQNMMTREVAKEQPYIERLMLLGAVAQGAGPEKSFGFFDEVSQIIFNGETDGWNEGDHLANAAARAGFDLEAMETEAAAEKSRLAALIEENQETHEKLHWGVPCMIYNNEAFYGQDRIETLRWRLQQENG